MQSERPTTDGAPGASVSWARWVALFLAFTLEYYAISGSVDAQLVVSARGGSWSSLVNFERIARAAFLCATCALVLMRPSRAELRRLEARSERALWLVHPLLFALFWLVTRVLFASITAPSGPALLWLAAWAVLGVASALTLCIGLLGVPRVRPAALFGALGAGLCLALAMDELGRWTQELWRPFSAAALRMAAFLLRFGFPDVEVDAAHDVLSLNGFAVRVEAGCSGLESLGMSSVLTVLYLALFRRELRFPRAFLLLPLGLSLTWFGNGVRLALMMWIGARIDPRLALGGFHSKAGWVLFSSITLAVAYIGHHSSWFAKLPAHAQVTPDRQLTTAFLLPLTVLLAIALVSGMWGHSEGAGYALRMAFGLLALALLWTKYDDLRWREPGAPAACLLGLALGLVWLGTGWPFPATDASQALGSTGPWLVVRALGFCTVVPLAEELAFRGYLLRVLQNRHFERVSYRSGPWWAVAISSLVFGALHERWLAGSVAGLVYALIQIRGGRLRDAVLAHVTTNATLAAFALALQNPALFG